MFGASAINMIRGTVHFGSIVEDTSEKGTYGPCTGNYNFPIPSVNTLKKVSTGYPTDISVGFIEQSLEMAQEQVKSTTITITVLSSIYKRQRQTILEILECLMQ